MKPLLLACALVVLLAQPVPAGSLERGNEAYRRGDYAAALEQWQSLADEGDGRAQFQIGVLYDQGRGVPRNFASAVEWYHRAAEQGIPEAQFNLGVMYALGLGVEQDDEKYLEWNRSAAVLGVAKAQYNMGLRYRQGRGVEQDLPQALMWLGLAAAQGFEPARAESELCAGRMTPEQIAAAQRMGRAWRAESEGGSSRSD